VSQSYYIKKQKETNPKKTIVKTARTTIPQITLMT